MKETATTTPGIIFPFHSGESKLLYQEEDQDQVTAAIALIWGIKKKLE